MKLYPAIDVLGGRAVRLLYGKRDQVTDYGDPVDCAKRWVDEGAEILHVVDLSGAFGEEGGFEKVLERDRADAAARVFRLRRGVYPQERCHSENGGG